MRYAVSIEIDNKRLYYRKGNELFHDDFVADISAATLCDREVAEEMGRFIRQELNAPQISETVKILPVNIEQ